MKRNGLEAPLKPLCFIHVVIHSTVYLARTLIRNTKKELKK